MNLGRTLVLAGLLLTAVGCLVLLLGKFGLPFGRLPGDLVWRGRNSTFYFPWVSCLLLSLIASFVLWLVNRNR